MCLLSIHYYFENYFSSLTHMRFFATGNTLTPHIGFLFHTHTKLFCCMRSHSKKLLSPQKLQQTHMQKSYAGFLRRFLLLLLSQSEFISSYHRFTSNGIREFLLVPIGSTGSAIRYSESDRRSHTLQNK